MKKFTFILIPPHHRKTFTFKLSEKSLGVFVLVLSIALFFSSYLTIDYINLKNIENKISKLETENSSIRSEAKLINLNLSKLKGLLHRLKMYTNRIDALVGLKISRVKSKTGIGPLTIVEEKARIGHKKKASTNYFSFPPGINPDFLEFKPTLDSMFSLNKQADKQVNSLRDLLASLSHKQSLLNATPTILPCSGWITSGFGIRVSPFTNKKTWHRGIDIASAIGTPIYSPADGVVIYSGKKPGYGNFIMIAHYQNGLVTKYGHNSENMVVVGQKVKKGDKIATVGITGRTTGPHLHYEVWSNGRPVNPKKFILNKSSNIF